MAGLPRKHIAAHVLGLGSASGQVVREGKSDPGRGIRRFAGPFFHLCSLLP
jgi:hypothetical protein